MKMKMLKNARIPNDIIESVRNGKGEDGALDRPKAAMSNPEDLAANLQGLPRSIQECNVVTSLRKKGGNPSRARAGLQHPYAVRLR
jgi:hypothetical protein